jgi:hypothetical protein
MPWPSYGAPTYHHKVASWPLYGAKRTGCANRKGVVAKDGIEPPTQGFSILCSTN